MSLQFTNQAKVIIEAGGFVFEVGANELSNVLRMVRGRLRFEREAKIATRAGLIELTTAERSHAARDDGNSTLHLSREDQAAFASIPPKRGDYPLPSGAGIVRVVPTEIWNGDRTKIERVVG
jgi:hypothetical protein